MPTTAMTSRLLVLFTRTPLHVGAGSSVGAIDQPVIRERHTGMPIIPASSLKGSFADHWNHTLVGDSSQKGKRMRGGGEAAWLFGSDDAREDKAAAGALLFGEARLVAFPIRSARGSFAWITSPLLLARAARDGLLGNCRLPSFPANGSADGQALFVKGGSLDLDQKIVLEEYTFHHSGGDETQLKALGKHLAQLLPDDPVWAEVAERLVVVSDGQMSFFATTACEVAQHVRISDETGTADPGGLFNQENVPAETLFYAVLHAQDSRLLSEAYSNSDFRGKTAREAMTAFSAKTAEKQVFQFGGDASTGLGYCSVKVLPESVVTSRG